eukprot:Nk52_evm51s554 gene=Nk52_evmTU51s554
MHPFVSVLGGAKRPIMMIARLGRGFQNGVNIKGQVARPLMACMYSSKTEQINEVLAHRNRAKQVNIIRETLPYLKEASLEWVGKEHLVLPPNQFKRVLEQNVHSLDTALAGVNLGTKRTLISNMVPLLCAPNYMDKMTSFRASLCDYFSSYEVDEMINKFPGLFFVASKEATESVVSVLAKKLDSMDIVREVLISNPGLLGVEGMRSMSTNNEGGYDLAKHYLMEQESVLLRLLGVPLHDSADFLSAGVSPKTSKLDRDLADGKIVQELNGSVTKAIGFMVDRALSLCGVSNADVAKDILALHPHLLSKLSSDDESFSQGIYFKKCQQIVEQKHVLQKFFGPSVNVYNIMRRSLQCGLPLDFNGESLAKRLSEASSVASKYFFIENPKELLLDNPFLMFGNCDAYFIIACDILRTEFPKCTSPGVFFGANSSIFELTYDVNLKDMDEMDSVKRVRQKFDDLIESRYDFFEKLIECDDSAIRAKCALMIARNPHMLTSPSEKLLISPSEEKLIKDLLLNSGVPPSGTPWGRSRQRLGKGKQLWSNMSDEKVFRISSRPRAASVGAPKSTFDSPSSEQIMQRTFNIKTPPKEEREKLASHLEDFYKRGNQVLGDRAEKSAFPDRSPKHRKATIHPDRLNNFSQAKGRHSAGHHVPAVDKKFSGVGIHPDRLKALSEASSTSRNQQHKRKKGKFLKAELNAKKNEERQHQRMQERMEQMYGSVKRK